jgi:hypothetical protein
MIKKGIFRKIFVRVFSFSVRHFNKRLDYIFISKGVNSAKTTWVIALTLVLFS